MQAEKALGKQGPGPESPWSRKALARCNADTRLCHTDCSRPPKAPRSVPSTNPLGVDQATIPHAHYATATELPNSSHWRSPRGTCNMQQQAQQHVWFTLKHSEVHRSHAQVMSTVLSSSVLAVYPSEPLLHSELLRCNQWHAHCHLTCSPEPLLK
jgi:hypothetical protein